MGEKKGKRTYEDLNDEQKAIFNAMKIYAYQLGRNFIESLKTSAYKEALDTVDNLKGLSDEKFEQLVEERCEILDEFEYNEAKRIIEKRKRTYDSGNEALTLREIILLDIQSIIHAHNYYEGNS